MVTKEKRPRRGTTWAEQDLLETKVHYHVKNKCLNKTNFSERDLLVPPMLKIEEEHINKFISDGVDVNK